MSKRTALLVGASAVLLGLGAWFLLGSRGASSASSGTSSPTTSQTTAAAPGPGNPGAPHGTAHAINPNASVTLDPSVTQGLVDFARKPWTTVPLRKEEHARARAMMRAVAGRAIDLEKAHARKSNRFRRTSYTQDVTSDTPIRLGDRW